MTQKGKMGADEISGGWSWRHQCVLLSPRWREPRARARGRRSGLRVPTRPPPNGFNTLNSDTCPFRASLQAHPLQRAHAAPARAPNARPRGQQRAIARGPSSAHQPAAVSWRGCRLAPPIVAPARSPFRRPLPSSPCPRAGPHQPAHPSIRDRQARAASCSPDRPQLTDGECERTTAHEPPRRAHVPRRPAARCPISRGGAPTARACVIPSFHYD